MKAAPAKKKNAAGKKPAKTSKKKATAKNKIKYKGREVVDEYRAELGMCKTYRMTRKGDE